MPLRNDAINRVKKRIKLHIPSRKNVDKSAKVKKYGAQSTLDALIKQ
jgi:hypothetical protein